MKKAPVIQRLYTLEGEKLRGMPWTAYPRLQLRRARWLCLNGEWEFSAHDGEKSTIRVPFCPESLLSGYEGTIEYGKTLSYARMFSIPEDWGNARVLLHFGAVSRACTVRVNGAVVCKHENAYLPFTADITDALQAGENRLEISCVNDLSPVYPWGKQKIKRGGMWYTPVSGIWQSVWLEPVPESYIRALRIETDLASAQIEFSGIQDGELVCEGISYPIRGGKACVRPADPKHWTPETPFLYTFTAKSGEDEIESYFALRTLTIEKKGGVPRLCLNGEPYFFHGLLDQGYFSDGLYTPAAPALYAQDISRMKALGFNTLRKHIKVEPEQFYYDCDRLGMLVWQDMVNSGRYRFFHDTLLPTLGFQTLSDRRTNRGASRAEFYIAMAETVDSLYNHPSICLWTIFNEGWGQFEADKAYEKLKALDKSRFIDSTSGWFRQKKSDVESLHIYFGKLHLGKRREKAQVLSEFGGYVYKLPANSFNLSKTYGYKIFAGREAMAKAIRKLYLDELVPLAEQGLCASIYTQVSDVEDETNGLLTYDRRVCKLAEDETADIAQALADAVRGNSEKREIHS